MEINPKQELTDYRLLCVLCLGIDKLGEMYMRDVAIETERRGVHFMFNFLHQSQVRFRLKCDSV